MKSEQQNIGELYSSIAMNRTEEEDNSIVIPKIKEPRDMVYSGDLQALNYRTSGANVAKLLKKEKKQKKVSPLYIILMLVAIAVGSVLYIGNILSVSRLLMQNNQLQIKHKENLSEQELLKAQINRLSSLERIQKIATEQFMLRNPKSIPQWLEVKSERIKEIETILQQKSTEHK